jgi:predicted O-methyltransferase YrrM
VRRSLLDSLRASRRVRDTTKALTFRAFLLGDKAGVHVTPRHYYSPLPDYRWLRTNQGLWAEPADMGVIPGWDLDRQLDWIEGICTPYYDEVAGLEMYRSVNATGVGIGFGQTDSQVLHCFIRAMKPGRVIEIGSGYSTAFMLEAAGRNAAFGGTMPQFVCIEPSPRAGLRALGNVELIEAPCQEVGRAIFDELGEGDLLFVDSTHSVRTGSDVVHTHLRIVPSLNPGVFVHVHDVNLPYLHSRDALAGFWGSQETALLYALLVHNRKLTVLASLSALHYGRREGLRRIIHDHSPGPEDRGMSLVRQDVSSFACSLWLQTK